MKPPPPRRENTCKDRRNEVYCFVGPDRRGYMKALMIWSWISCKLSWAI